MSPGETRRVVVIDDHPLLRKGLQQLADLSPNVEIVGECDSGEQGLKLVEELRPDLVLLDLGIPGMGGLGTLQALKELSPAPWVVVLTVSDAQEDIVAALRRGADGYLLKDMDPEELLNRIGELEHGERIFSPTIIERLGEALQAPVHTLVVIDDHPLLRKGLKQLVDLCPDIEIIGEANNGVQGLRMVEELRPGLVVLDLNMPGMSGLDALDGLKRLNPAPKVMILTVSDAEEDVIASIRAGADGYILKDTDPEEILSKLHDLARGRLVISPAVAECLALALRDHPKKVIESRAPDDLTEREREILGHLRSGESNKLIARNLNIAETTVKVHIKHLLKKLGLKSRVEAAVWAVTHKNEL